MKYRDIEINDRAIKVLNINNTDSNEKLKNNFKRQIKLVNPYAPTRKNCGVPGYSNLDVAKLLVQSYILLKNKKVPTSMIKDYGFRGILEGFNNLVPIAETSIKENFDLLSHYDFGLSWPESSEKGNERIRYKFGGVY